MTSFMIEMILRSILLHNLSFHYSSHLYKFDDVICMYLYMLYITCAISTLRNFIKENCQNMALLRSISSLNFIIGFRKE